MKKINLGSADTRADGWVNLDATLGPNVDVVGDARYLFMQDKPDVIRASHILEHAAPCETLYVLRNWYETMKNGGRLIIGVPDFDFVLRRLASTPENYLCFWNNSFDPLLFKALYGNFYAHPPKTPNIRFRHFAVFNEYSLSEILGDAGFVDVTRVTISCAEDNEGFDDSMLRPWSLNMTARKPN